jgi:hypothetical protein
MPARTSLGRSTAFGHIFSLLLPAWLIALAATPSATAGGSAAVPVDVRFLTLDGSKIAGKVVRWDRQGFDGTFGRMEWSRLNPPEAWHVHAALIDPRIAEHWLDMGKMLSTLEGGQELAERAFRWAAWLSRVTARTAEELAARLPPMPPHLEFPLPLVHADDAGPFEPWPERDADEQAAAVAELKEAADVQRRALSLEMRLRETEFALVYSELPPDRTAQVIDGLGLTYKTLLSSFRLPLDRNVFWGKLVVVLCKDKATFDRVVGKSGRSIDGPHMGGLCVPEGPRVTLFLWDQPNRRQFDSSVPHELTHAFLHRYRTPAPMPLWLEEGFADFVASLVHKDSPVDTDHGDYGRWFIRNGGPIDNMLDMRCTHDGWPGPHACGYGVGYLFVDQMFRHSREAALACIAAVKSGKPWEKALDEDLGLTRQALRDRVIERVRTDDAARRAKPLKETNAQ